MTKDWILPVVFFMLVGLVILGLIMLVGYQSEQVEMASLDKVLIIPLDDRPVNVDFIKANATIGGMEIIMPPEDYIGTVDKPGNPDKLLQWILSKGDKVDHFVISATMMNHGGLIHSRLIDEYKGQLEWIDVISSRFPDKKIYVYDVIQRLAPSVFTDDDLEDYRNIREWGILQDKDNGNSERIKELETMIGNELLNKYIETREINHKLNLGLIDKVSEDKIDLLILAQDDASEFGIHNKEQDLLINKIEKKRS